MMFLAKMSSVSQCKSKALQSHVRFHKQLQLTSCGRMARAQNKANKLAVLKIINHKKDYLFGSFQKNKITKTEKQAAWTEVLKTAQSLGLASANRDWTYARDHIFGLWKSRTLAKRDNAKRTGTEGSKNAILDEVDNFILDILGNESAVLQGLGQPESDGVSSNLESKFESIQPECQKSNDKNNHRKRKLDLAEKQVNLRVYLLETEIYKNKLEILWLEKKLGIKRSKFTADLEEESRSEKGNEIASLKPTEPTSLSPLYSEKTLNFTDY